MVWQRLLVTVRMLLDKLPATHGETVHCRWVGHTQPHCSHTVGGSARYVDKVTCKSPCAKLQVARLRRRREAQASALTKALGTGCAIKRGDSAKNQGMCLTTIVHSEASIDHQVVRTKNAASSDHHARRTCTEPGELRNAAQRIAAFTVRFVEHSSCCCFVCLVPCEFQRVLVPLLRPPPWHRPCCEL